MSTAEPERSPNEDAGEEEPTLRLRRRPEGPAAPSVGADRRAELADAARAYQDFRRQPDAGDLDAWCATRKIPPQHARLFHEMHNRDPQAAERLAQALTSFPEVGQHFLGFELTAELGRGAFARVYLARQQELGNRYVVLKVTDDVRTEAQTLAQLQHTNIVPLYSVHQHEPFQAVCMPYLGATTLADVLRDLRALAALPQSGADLVRIL